MYTETNLFFNIPFMISFFTCNVFEVTAFMVNNAASRVTDENFDEHFIFQICPVYTKISKSPADTVAYYTALAVFFILMRSIV